MDALSRMTPHWLDTISTRSLVVTPRGDLNPAKEVKEKANRTEKVIINVNQKVAKANTTEKTDLDRNGAMTSDRFVDAVDHHPKDANLKKGANLVHLRPDLLV